MKEEKKLLRAQIKQKIQEFKEINESKILCEKLMSSSYWENAKNIMIYAPIKGEVNVFHLFKDTTKNFYFPQVQGSEMKVLNVLSLKDLQKGEFGILEPKGSCSHLDPKDLDLVIVPGLAFTELGDRLGRGGGFYDRFIQKLSYSTKTISLVFPFQLLQEIPMESHDQKIQKIIF